MGVQTVPALCGEFKIKIIAGHRTAQTQFIKEWRPVIRLHLIKSLRFTKQDADDCAQEVLIKIFAKLHTLEDDSKIKSWILTITHNTGLNFIRQIRNRKEDDLDNDFEKRNDVTYENPESLSISSQLSSQAIQFVYTQLPKQQREAVILRVFNEKSFGEIADLMGCPYNTAKANYRHGILKLREFLDPESFLREDSCEPKHVEVQ